MNRRCYGVGVLAGVVGAAAAGCGFTGDRPGFFSRLRGNSGACNGTPCSMSELPLGPGGFEGGGPIIGDPGPLPPGAIPYQPGVVPVPSAPPPPPPATGLLPVPSPPIPSVVPGVVPPPAQTFPAGPPPAAGASVPKAARTTSRGE